MEQENIVECYDHGRIHDRKKYDAGISFIHADRLYTGFMMNLSLGGAYIATHSVNQFSTNDMVTINIPYTSGKKMVKRRGRVKWQNNAGFGVEFI